MRTWAILNADNKISNLLLLLASKMIWSVFAAGFPKIERLTFQQIATENSFTAHLTKT